MHIKTFKTCLQNENLEVGGEHLQTIYLSSFIHLGLTQK